MNTINIILSFGLTLLAIVTWLAWEIHQKLHRMLEIQFQSLIAHEKRLNDIIKQLEKSSQQARESI